MAHFKLSVILKQPSRVPENLTISSGEPAQASVALTASGLGVGPGRPLPSPRSLTSLSDPGRCGTSPASLLDPSGLACLLWLLRVDRAHPGHTLCQVPGGCQLPWSKARLGGRDTSRAPMRVHSLGHRDWAAWVVMG